MGWTVGTCSDLARFTAEDITLYATTTLLAAELGFAPRPSGFRDRWTTVIPLSNNLEPSPEIASGSSRYECEVLLIERRRQKDWYARPVTLRRHLFGRQRSCY